MDRFECVLLDIDLFNSLRKSKFQKMNSEVSRLQALKIKPRKLSRISNAPIFVIGLSRPNRLI